MDVKLGNLKCLGELALGERAAKIRLNPVTDELTVLLAERDEARVVRWRSGYAMDTTCRLGTGIKLKRKAADDETRFLDLAYHPGGELLALAGRARAVELYRVADGKLVRSFGNATVNRQEEEVQKYLDRCRANRVKPDKTILEATRLAFAEPAPDVFGFVGFSADGAALVAGSKLSKGEVFSVDTGKLLGRFFVSDDPVAFVPHPSGDLFTWIETDWSYKPAHGQVCFGRLTAQSVDVRSRMIGLNGQSPHGAVFSPDGRLLACVGIEASLTLDVIELPPCSIVYELCDHSANYRAPLPHLKVARPFVERVIWSPDSERILCPFPTGNLVEVDARTAKALRKFKAHDTLIVSCDVRYKDALMTTLDLEGTVKLWQLPYAHSPDAPAKTAKSVAAAYLKDTRSVDPLKPEFADAGEDIEPPMVFFSKP